MRYAATGGVTASGAQIKVKTLTAGVSVRLIISRNADLSSPVATLGPITTSAPSLVATFNPSGLAANALHYYGVEEDGVVAADKGRFRTSTATGTVQSFTLGFGSCCDDGSSRYVFEKMFDKGVEVFFHLGDFHYKNFNGDDDAQRRADYDANGWNANRQRLLYRSTDFWYMADDHDSCGDNTSRTFVGVPSYQRVHREMFPTHPMPVAGSVGPLYRSGVRGRVRLIMLDTRTERDAPGTTGGVMLSATQEQWLLDQISAAKAAAQVVVIGSTVVWCDDKSTGDAWGRYQAQRTRIANHIQGQGMNRSVAFVSGDAHMIAVNDGTNTNYATSPSGLGPPQLVGAAFGKAGTIKGGPWTHGPFANSNQYGLLKVTDTGGTTVSLRFEGWYAPSSTTAETLKTFYDFTLDPNGTAPAPGNAAPTCAMQAPAAGASFAAGSTVTLAASAADSDGSIAGVKFYTSAGALIGSATFDSASGWWQRSWSPASGSHTVYAVATDSAGATGQSATRTFSIAEAPGATDTYALGWSYTASADAASGFRVQESVNSGSWTAIAELGSAARTHSFGRTQDTNKRRWRVVSYNSAGESAPTNIVSDGKP